MFTLFFFLSLRHVQLFVTHWIVAYQAPPSMGFSRQEYRSGLPFPSLGDLHDPGIEPASPVSPESQADSLSTEPLGKPMLTLRPQKMTDHILQLNITPTGCAKEAHVQKEGHLRNLSLPNQRRGRSSLEQVVTVPMWRLRLVVVVVMGLF